MGEPIQKSRSIKLFGKEILTFGYDVVNIGGQRKVVSGIPRTVAGKRITVKLVEFLQTLTAFDAMQDEEIQEQLLVWDPEIGGALDRQSTLVSQCYKGPILRTSAIKTPKGTQADKLETDMLTDAMLISESMRANDMFETYAELLVLYGDLFLDVRDPLTYKIMPNRFVTLIEDLGQIGIIQANWLMTQPNILVFNEMIPTMSFWLLPGEFIHLKYKDTPVFAVDRRGRWTYGMYSISPVQRAVISTWQSRITSIIDILYRFRIIPREVHSVNAQMFSLDQYEGSQSERLAASQADANKYINAYNQSIASQAPDSGYTILDNIKVELMQGVSATYMKTNELIDQLDSKKWVAMNMPKSVVTGEHAGSYASELVVSNYVSQKAIQIAQKIKPIVLKNMRARLLMVNDQYPVDKLDLKLELSMAATDLEQYRQAAIMGSLGCFTRNEIREQLGWQPLDPKFEDDIVMGNMKTLGDIMRDTQSMKPGGQFPKTPQSDSQGKQDTGQQSMRGAESTQ